MRSVHGTFATLLLMVPVLSIPALAIFGIPQFAPVVASPLDEGATKARERRVGQSARPINDNMEDLEDAPLFGSEPGEPGSALPPGRVGDSVPITRPGRSNRDKETVIADVNPQPRGKMPPSKAGWLDEFDDEPRSQPEEPRNQPAPGFDVRDNTPRAQPGDGMRGPKAFQRRREQPPEPAPKVSNPLDIEPLTWQSAVRKLNELEIRNFRLQPGHRENQFLFICSYTPSDSPRLSYRYEAEADEPLKAVEKVLEQILESQQRR